MSDEKSAPLGEVVIDDPHVVLEIIKDAIHKKPVDRRLAVNAIRQVLKNYEEQLRVFMIGAANVEVGRVVKLLQFIDVCSDQLMSAEKMKTASYGEVLRAFQLCQQAIETSSKAIKLVADMRLDAAKATGGSENIAKMFDPEKETLDPQADMPQLGAQSRDKIRRIMIGLQEAIAKDDAVKPNEP